MGSPARREIHFHQAFVYCYIGCFFFIINILYTEHSVASNTVEGRTRMRIMTCPCNGLLYNDGNGLPPTLAVVNNNLCCLIEFTQVALCRVFI